MFTKGQLQQLAHNLDEMKEFLSVGHILTIKAKARFNKAKTRHTRQCKIMDSLCRARYTEKFVGVKG